MLKDLLKEVIGIVAGKPVEDIADILYSKKHVNEFLIAKKLDITINQTRNILYKISDYGLVSSIRKKDKRKGWYTYFWKIEVVKSLSFLRGILLKKISQFENKIKSRETKIFYECKNCNIEFNEENALLRDFTCNECGRIFTQKDNTKVLREFKRNLEKLKKQLAITDEEMKKEVEKEEKIKARELKKINDARKELLLKKRLERQKLMKKNKKETKKPIKLKKKPAKKKKSVKKLSKKKKVTKKPIKLKKKPAKKLVKTLKKVLKKKSPIRSKGSKLKNKPLKKVKKKKK
jgi:transcription factor E